MPISLFMMASVYNCPRCGSENTSTFGMIHLGGTSTGSFRAVSFGLDAGVIGTGGKTNSQNLLAQQTAPPVMPLFTFWHLLVAALPAMFSFTIFLVLFQIPAIAFILSIIIFAVSLFYQYKVIDRKQAICQKEIEQWNNSWMCLKCGNTFGKTDDNTIDTKVKIDLQ